MPQTAAYSSKHLPALLFFSFSFQGERPACYPVPRRRNAGRSSQREASRCTDSPYNRRQAVDLLAVGAGEESIVGLHHTQIV